MHNLDMLPNVAEDDINALIRAHENYGDSWKKRGGVGAFMMLARKWDRLENFLSKAYEKYDILYALSIDRRAEGIIDDIRDLRRYLFLVEAEARVQGFCPGEVNKDEPKEEEVPEPEEVETKPGQYNFMKACNETDSSATITIRDAQDPSVFVTTISSAETEKILRGEQPEQFSPQFLAQVIRNWMGRAIKSFEYLEGRLVVKH